MAPGRCCNASLTKDLCPLSPPLPPFPLTTALALRVSALHPRPCFLFYRKGSERERERAACNKRFRAKLTGLCENAIRKRPLIARKFSKFTINLWIIDIAFSKVGYMIISTRSSFNILGKKIRLSLSLLIFRKFIFSSPEFIALTHLFNRKS